MTTLGGWTGSGSRSAGYLFCTHPVDTGFPGLRPCGFLPSAGTVEGMSRHRPLGVAATFLVFLLSLVSLEGVGLAPAYARPTPVVSSRTPVVPRPPEVAVLRTLPAPRSAPVDALCPQWWGPAQAVGWEYAVLRDLDVVMHRESRCEPDVWNREDPMGGSRGLLQVNGSWTRWLRERGVLTVKEDLFDPAVNLRAALAIYEYGTDRYGFGWGPWGFRYVDPYQG